MMQEQIKNWIEWNTFLGCLEFIEFTGDAYVFAGLGEDDFEVSITVNLANQILVDDVPQPFNLPFNVWSN